jgi:hypothetical protein
MHHALHISWLGITILKFNYNQENHETFVTQNSSGMKRDIHWKSVKILVELIMFCNSTGLRRTLEPKRDEVT